MRTRFQLERRSEGYVARIAFLCFLLSVSSLAAFMMDPVDGTLSYVKSKLALRHY